MNLYYWIPNKWSSSTTSQHRVDWYLCENSWIELGARDAKQSQLEDLAVGFIQAPKQWSPNCIRCWKSGSWQSQSTSIFQVSSFWQQSYKVDLFSRSTIGNVIGSNKAANLPLILVMSLTKIDFLYVTGLASEMHACTLQSSLLSALIACWFIIKGYTLSLTCSHCF